MSELGIERVGAAAVARPGGDIDAANAASVGEQLASAIAHDVAGLIVDLSEVRYVDSAGLDMLFRLNERLRQRRGALVVVIPDSAPLRRLATIVGLPRAMPVHGTVEAAIEALPPSAAGSVEDEAECEPSENGV